MSTRLSALESTRILLKIHALGRVFAQWVTYAIYMQFFEVQIFRGLTNFIIFVVLFSWITLFFFTWVAYYTSTIKKYYLNHVVTSLEHRFYIFGDDKVRCLVNQKFYHFPN